MGIEINEPRLQNQVTGQVASQVTGQVAGQVTGQVTGQDMDEVNDARLLAIATVRLANYDPATVLSEEEMNVCIGVTSDELADFEGVEIE